MLFPRRSPTSTELARTKLGTRIQSREMKELKVRRQGRRGEYFSIRVRIDAMRAPAFKIYYQVYLPMRSQDIFMTDKTAKTTIIVIGPVTKSVIERFGQTATGQTARYCHDS